MRTILEDYAQRVGPVGLLGENEDLKNKVINYVLRTGLVITMKV